MHINKNSYIWWAFSTIIGGIVGILFAQHVFLNTPISLLVTASEYIKIILSTMNMAPVAQEIIFMSAAGVVLAIPRIAMLGILVGVVATKITYQRTLIYSAIIWPVLLLVLQYVNLIRFEQGTKLAGLPAIGLNQLWADLVQNILFCFTSSVIFLFVVLSTYFFTKKHAMHNKAN